MLPLPALPGPLPFIDLCVSASMRRAVTLGSATLAVTTQRSSLGFLPERRKEPSPWAVKVAPSSDLGSAASKVAQTEALVVLTSGSFNQLSKRFGNSSRSKVSRATSRGFLSFSHFANPSRYCCVSMGASISLRMVSPKVEVRR